MQRQRRYRSSGKKDSWTNQIVTLRIIIEQSIEWNSLVYINFTDFEKAFDSLDHETMWKLMRYYGILEKLISIIKITYKGMNCRVLHEGKTTNQFEVKTGMKQGCILSLFLFLMVIDWTMRASAEQWILWEQLDDLDFADDRTLPSHNQK